MTYGARLDRGVAMTPVGVVVVGGSAGAIAAAQRMLGALPTDLPVGVLIVLHTAPNGKSALAHVLQRSSAWPVADARHGDQLEAGQVYLAPSDHHLLLDNRTLLLTRSPKVNRVRPAVDPLFRSAARWWGRQTVGVVLSGNLDDGSAGLAAIAGRGGAAIIQEDPLFGGMPRAALLAVPAAQRLAAADLADGITRSVSQLGGHSAITEGAETRGAVSLNPAAAVASRDDETLGNGRGSDRDLVEEAELAQNNEPTVPVLGDLTIVACPECRGAMSFVAVGKASYYRCHVGHSYSPQTLLAAQQENSEAALWTAVSILEEQAAVYRRLSERAGVGPERRAAHEASAVRAAEASRAVRRMIEVVESSALEDIEA